MDARRLSRDYKARQLEADLACAKAASATNAARKAACLSAEKQELAEETQVKLSEAMAKYDAVKAAGRDEFNAVLCGKEENPADAASDNSCSPILLNKTKAKSNKQSIDPANIPSTSKPVEAFELSEKVGLHPPDLPSPVKINPFKKRAYTFEEKAAVDPAGAGSGHGRGGKAVTGGEQGGRGKAGEEEPEVARRAAEDAEWDQHFGPLFVSTQNLAEGMGWPPFR